MKCLWCNEELSDGALFCSREWATKARPDTCGLAYVKMLKLLKHMVGQNALSEFEIGVLKLVKKYKLENLEAEAEQRQVEQNEVEQNVL